MKRFRSVLLLFGLSILVGLKAETPVQETPVDTYDTFCSIRNNSFLPGEELKFTVYYSLFGLFVNAGHATAVTSLEHVNNKPVYHVVGTGGSNSSYSWVGKVNNRYESYIDTMTFQPVRFVRNVHENNHKKYENVTFNRAANTAISNDGVFKVPACVQDVVSSIYFARNINFDKYKPGDKISFSMFIDNEVYNMYIRFMGKEEIKTKYGRFRTIKIKPLLVKGDVFDGGEKMNLWVTDDANRIPVRAESPLTVGSVKVDMMGYKNLRYPLTSLVKMR